ncbi:MAG: thioredoxin-disulfide reductase [Chloroflexota bacterium]
MLSFDLPQDSSNRTFNPVEIYDTVIIGGGPAGLTAGLYAARAGLKAVILEMAMPGGQAATTERIENYPGFVEGIGGAELTARMAEQALRFGAKTITAEVTGVEIEGETKRVSTPDGEFAGRTIIVATGARSSRLGVAGEAEFTGRGVSYCATCDGPFYRDLPIAVIGGGDSAIEEALYLTRFASKVTVVHRRDQLRATKVLQDRAFANPKIEFRWNSVVDSIRGGEFVESIQLRDVKTGSETSLAVSGVFLYVGLQPNTAFLRGKLQLDAQGYVVTDERMATDVPGVFAAGDVRAKPLRQVASAVADGALAAVMADHYIHEGK